MLVLVCAHNTLFSPTFSSHLRVHWKTGCLSSGCYNKNMITERLKEPMFISSVLEVGSPRSRCLQMWPGEGPSPDLQMVVFWLQTSSHSGGQREGMVLFSCKCEGHHEGSTFMTWHDYLPEALSPKPVTLRMRVLAYEFGGHTVVQSIAKSLRLSFTCSLLGNTLWGRERGRMGSRIGQKKRGSCDWGFGQSHRGLWSWAGPSECSEMRQGIDLHIDLSLDTGCCLGRVWPWARQWLGRVSAVSPCATGDLVASDSILHRTVRNSEHLTSILTTVHHPGPTLVVSSCKIAFLMVLATPSGRT